MCVLFVCVFVLRRYPRDMTVDRDTVSSFMREDSASAEILKEMATEARNEDLAVSLVVLLSSFHGLLRFCCNIHRPIC